MKLTKTSVKKPEVTGKRYNQFDDDLKGFALRVGDGGDKAFRSGSPKSDRYDRYSTPKEYDRVQTKEPCPRLQSQGGPGRSFRREDHC